MSARNKKKNRHEMEVRADDGEYEFPPDIINAAYSGNVKQVRELLEQGEDVNSVDPGDNLSILHIGCMQGDEELVDLILEWDDRYGSVDFSVRTRYRPRLAWQLAMTSGHVELAHRVDFAGLAKLGLSSRHPAP